MAFSTYMANRIIDIMVNGGAAPLLANTYVSLHTGDPGNTGANEATYTSYARVAVASGTAGFAVAATKTTDNENAITFPENTGTLQAVTHVGIWDAASTGNFIIGGALSGSTDIGAGGIPEFAAGDLDLTLT